MKKTLLALTCGAALFAGSAQADTLGFEVGASLWQTSVDDPDFDKGDNTVIYAAFEHPVPVLPNIRVSINSIKNDDKTSPNTLDTSFNDFLMYYEVLDNVVELDLGFGARMYDGSYGNTKLDPTLGMVYAKAQVNLPVTGLSLGADVLLGADSGDNKAQDLSAYVRWESSLGLGLTGGYRMLNATFETNNNGGTGDVDLDGAYISAFYHF